jgi:hypothetical protein
MVEALSTLATFTTKMMKERRYRGLLLLVYPFLTDGITENVLRGLVLWTDFEDVQLQRLDELTEEENFIYATTNFKAIHHVDGGTSTTKGPIHGIDDKVNTSRGDEHRGIKIANESRVYISLSFSMRVPIWFFRVAC